MAANCSMTRAKLVCIWRSTASCSRSLTLRWMSARAAGALVGHFAELGFEEDSGLSLVTRQAGREVGQPLLHGEARVADRHARAFGVAALLRQDLLGE